MPPLFMESCICELSRECSLQANLTFLRCLAAVPIQFAEDRGWGPVTSELPFLALLLGIIMGGLANI